MYWKSYFSSLQIPVPHCRISILVLSNNSFTLSNFIKIDTVDFGLFPDWLTLKGWRIALLAILSFRTYFKDAFFATFASSLLSCDFVNSGLEMLVSFIIRCLLLTDGTVIKHPARLPVCERILLLRGTLGTARALHSLNIHNLDAAFETTESLWVFVQFTTLHFRFVFWLK